MLDVTHRMPLLRKKWKLEVFPQNKKTSFDVLKYRLEQSWAFTYTTAMQPYLFHFVLYKSSAASWS